jgi:DNA-binding LacI/PurR family transcriptional regulator
MPVVRLKDIAGKAKVSVATASLALAGKGRISDAVRERVHAVASQLGYRAGRAVRARPVAGTMVGILHVEDRGYEWNFIRPTLLELERALLQKGYSAVLIPALSGAQSEHVVAMVAATGVSAVFAIQFADGKAFESLEQRGVRVVVINNSEFQDRFHSVCVDDFQGAYEGTLSLLNLGHRSIAFVEYERPDSPAVVADRFIGFRKALDEHRLAFPPELRITIPFMDAKRLEKRLATLFSRAAKPTAIFAHDDYLGLYVIDALAELGLEVPRDVSLVAPGDVLDYSLPRMPQITTMRINTAMLGRIAANLMLERLRGDYGEVHVLKVKEQLVRRATCRKL